MNRSRLFALPVCLGLFLASTTTAEAHFKLLKPMSWLKEDNTGGPQKGSPCGPGGLDDANPIPTSGAITQYKAGETITVEWTDTVAHPGYFRIALAENRSDLKNPTIKQGADCSFLESDLPKTASGNVLADGVAFRSREGFSDSAGKKFSQKVTLPNKPCEKCTLQVMQIMENDLQALSNCYYFHCADIKIVADTGAADGGAGTSGTVTYPDGGTSKPGTGDGDDDDSTGDGDSGDGDGDSGDGDQEGSVGGPGAAAPKSDSGCSVGVATRGESQALLLVLGALGLAVGSRRLAKRRKS